MMQQIHLDFIKSYQKMMATVQKSETTEYYLVNDEVRKFHKQWNGFFKHHGYYDVPLQSTIGIAACVAEKITKTTKQ